MTRNRLDQELVTRGLLPTRSGARAAIVDGLVRVDGETVAKPAAKIAATAVVELAAGAGRYVGRGAYKLEAALAEFGIGVEGRTAIDVGSSTGGFTQVLLNGGASSVVAVDGGRDQLHPQLRADQRVEVHEGTNIRYVDGAPLGAPFDIITVDLSFISLGVVAGVLAGLGGEESDWVVLVKPQFEVERSDLGKGGVVRSATVRDAALRRVVDYFNHVDLSVVGAIPSPIIGGTGNMEALFWLRHGGNAVSVDNVFKVQPDA